MKLLSVYDLPRGKDWADLVADVLPADGPSPDRPQAFRRVSMRFYERGGTSASQPPEGVEEMLVVMQGRGRIVVEGVEHPVLFGDVVILDEGEGYRAVADEVDPFVLLSIAARIQ